MKTIIVLVAAIAIAQARPASDEPVAILKAESDFEPEGSYTFMFEGADGSFREEKGTIMNAGKEDAYVAVSGTYKYIDADGQPIEVHYTSDEKGFVPSGTNIPASIEKAARAAGEAH
ncbi:larval cuticle protein 1-like [Condylostylus longicornis]|uniref:larval cuticle protein 1-like n=1 Tax=Condylostylus longicornis TaxID=2530218 RepID=UPI00244E390C|nr:larval cuticle protein 1-like [Condylostylus longicornis]